MTRVYPVPNFFLTYSTLPTANSFPFERIVIRSASSSASSKNCVVKIRVFCSCFRSWRTFQKSLLATASNPIQIRLKGLSFQTRSRFIHQNDLKSNTKFFPLFLAQSGNNNILTMRNFKLLHDSLSFWMEMGFFHISDSSHKNEVLIHSILSEGQTILCTEVNWFTNFFRIDFFITILKRLIFSKNSWIPLTINWSFCLRNETRQNIQ